MLISCSAIFNSGYFAQVNLNDGLVAYYPLNNDRLDYSGNNNNGVAAGGTGFTADRFGNPNSAASFGGTGNAGKITVTDNPTIHFTTGATFAFWARVNSATGTFGNGSVGAGGSQCLFAKAGDAGGGLWQLSRFTTNTLTNEIGNNATPTLTGVHTPYALNQWFHYVVTMDANGHNIYVNGVLQSSNTSPANFAAMIGRNLVLGRFNSNWYPLNGALDEFRVYNRVINTDEIQALMADDLATISVSLAGPSTFCAGSEVTVNYTSTGDFAPNNTFNLQLSDANGNFANPAHTVQLLSSNNSGSVTMTIPQIAASGTGYRFRIISSAPFAISDTTSNISISGILQTIPDPALYNYVGSVGGNHYYLSTNQLTWHQAQNQALANGGHLAVIPNAQTNTLLANALSSGWAYIGFTDEVTEGTFLWVDGSPVTYTNWNAGEPNNAGGGEDYATIAFNGTWNDVPAVNGLSFLQLSAAGMNQTLCEGATIQFTAAEVDGASYSWTGPNGFSSNDLNPSISNSSILNSGTYTLTYSLNGCTATSSFNVNIQLLPNNFGEIAPLPALLNDGLVLHYPMNGNAVDALGANNGTIAGGVTPSPDRFGNENASLQFNGSNGHIVVPPGVYFDGSDFTVNAWVRKVSNNNWSRLFDFGNGSANDNILLGISNGTTGRPASQIYNGNASTPVVSSPTVALTNNKWELLTYTWSNGVGMIYIDGVLRAQGTQLTPLDVTRTINYIGRSNWAGDGYANARFDDFRIYNRVLSGVEIQALMLEQANALEAIVFNDNLCSGSSAQIVLYNTQPGVSYQLKNATSNANVGAAQLGTGDSLVFLTGALISTTEFYFTANFSLGCGLIETSEITVNINALPTPPVAINDTVCNSGVLTIGVTGTGTFNWYAAPTGGSPIVGISGASYTTPFLTETLTYYVSQTDQFGCESERTPVSAVVTNPLNAPVDIISGLILHYKFDGDYNDYSGNGYNASPNLVAASTYTFVNDRNDNPESALRSVSSNVPGANYLNAGNPQKVQQLTNQVTISMWIRQTQTWFGNTGTDGQMPLINKWDGNTGMWVGLRMQNPSNMSNRVRWRVNSGTFIESNTNVPVGVWHHVVCTYDGATLRIYQNGVQTASASHSGAIANTAINLFLGRQANGTPSGGITYRGDMDEVKIYNRALNLSEVQTLYNNESVAFATTPLCDGEGDLALTTFNFPGATYAWTGPNGFTSNLQNPTIINNADSATYSGTYSLLVTSQGCTSPPQTVDVTIYEIPLAPSTINDTICGSGNAVLTAQGAPSGASYRWYTQAVGGTPIAGQTGSTLTINNLNVTTFRYVSIIRNGCESPRTEVIAVYNSNVITNLPVVGENICQTDNLANIEISGSEPDALYQAFYNNNPISVLTAGGGTINLEINTTTLQLGANTISIQVTKPGCGALNLSNTATITLLASPSANISANGPLSFCSGESVELSAPANLDYLWSTGATTQNIMVSTAESISVTVTDANGCSAISNVVNTTVNATPLPEIAALGATTFCDGNTVTLTASGGNSYLWNNNATTSSIVVSTGGTYSFTAFNGSCSAVSNTINVVVNSLPSASITPNGPLSFCEGEDVVLSAPANLTYLWSNGATTQNVTINQNSSISVEVTDAYNCVNTSNVVNVVVNSAPNPQIAASGPLTFCEGGSVTLTASGGTSYTWNTGSNNASINVSTGGTYNVLASNGPCSATSNDIVVEILNNPIVGANASESAICEGESVSLSGSGAVSYVWNNNVTNGVAFIPASTTTYTVSGTGANGCVGTANITITVNPLPNASFTPEFSGFCSGVSSIPLNASGLGLSNYEWFLNGNSSVSGNSPTFTATEPGAYTLTVTNANGCEASSTLNLGTLADPTVSISSNSTTICAGSSEIITATPLSGAQYQWFLNGNPLGGQVSSNIFSANQVGSYSVVITNSGGCQGASNEIEFTAAPLPTAQISSNTSNICSGQTALLSAELVAGASYQWLLNGNPISGATSATYSANAAGSYQVVVSTDCSNTSNAINLVVQALPNAAGAISGSTSLCAGQSQTYSIANVPNATSYSWVISPANAASISVNNGNSVVVNPTNVNFTLTITPNNACGNGTPSQVNVTVSTSDFCFSEIMFAANNTNICVNNQITFTNYTNPNIFAGLTPVWNFGAGANPATATGNGPHTVSYNSTGLKTVTLAYQDVFGNVFDSEVKTNYINVSGTAQTSPISGNNAVLCNSASESYSVVNTSGSTYNWSVSQGATILSGQGTNSVVVNWNGNGGTLSVQETNAAGCLGSTINFTVTISNPVLTAAISGPNLVQCSSNSENYSVTNTAGSTYAWTVPVGAVIVSGQGTNQITVNFNGNFGEVSVQETNGNGCIGAGVMMNVNCNVGVHEWVGQGVKIYPNPTQNTFQIDFEQASESGALKLYDSQGVLVMENELSANTMIDIHAYAPGVYFGRITTENGTYSFRIVKQ